MIDLWSITESPLSPPSLQVQRSLLVTGFGYEHDDAWSTNLDLFKHFTDVSRVSNTCLCNASQQYLCQRGQQVTRVIVAATSRIPPDRDVLQRILRGTRILLLLCRTSWMIVFSSCCLLDRACWFLSTSSERQFEVNLMSFVGLNEAILLSSVCKIQVVLSEKKLALLFMSVRRGFTLTFSPLSVPGGSQAWSRCR
jgi:hypothetical protein